MAKLIAKKRQFAENHSKSCDKEKQTRDQKEEIKKNWEGENCFGESSGKCKKSSRRRLSKKITKKEGLEETDVLEIIMFRFAVFLPYFELIGKS